MPKYTQPRKTWQYSNEFKVKAVQLSLIEGIQVQDVANTLDIHPFMLSRWRKEYREGKIVADKRKKLTEATRKQEKEISKVKKLEAENKKLKQELDLLKKWQRFLAEEHQQDIDSSRSSDHDLAPIKRTPKSN
jgi:transposase